MVTFDPFPTLHTSRLLLRQLVPSDVDVVFRLKTDPDVMRYLGRDPYRSIDDAAQRIADITASIRDSTSIWWGITLRDAGPLVGTAGLWHWNKPHRSAEVGCDLLPEHWGRGLMTEALRPILRFGFEAMDLHRIEANLAPDNEASRRVLERLGFVREALLRENWLHEGRFTDTAVYGLLRRDLEPERPSP